LERILHIRLVQHLEEHWQLPQLEVRVLELHLLQLV